MCVYRRAGGVGEIVATHDVTRRDSLPTGTPVPIESSAAALTRRDNLSAPLIAQMITRWVDERLQRSSYCRLISPYEEGEC
jgi:hypothetical protein